MPEPVPPRKWYQKKRYAIPLGFAAFVVLVSALSSHSAAPQVSSTPPVVQQSNSTPQVQSATTFGTDVASPTPQQPAQQTAPSPIQPIHYYTNSDGNQVQSPTQYNTSSANTAPAGATAQCSDGSYSFSQHRSGTCSHHGGVAEWLN